jgi:hypothetical protein
METRGQPDTPNYPLRGTRQGEPSGGVRKLKYTHDAMIDLIIANPWISQNELGNAFGYTQAWVSTVMACDAFKMQLAKRREELVDPTIRATLAERTEAILTRSLQVLQEKLSAPACNVPDTLALRAFELGGKAMGLGGYAPPAQVPSADSLSNLANRLIDLQSNIRRNSQNDQAEEVEVREVGQREASVEDPDGRTLCGQGLEEGRPLQAAIRADRSDASEVQGTDGRSGITDCGLCGRAVCDCSQQDV